jgi:hypothetical protein
MGGVTGALRSGASLQNVTCNVDLTITGVNIGGLAGRVEQEVTYNISGCTYGGDINVTGNTVGGIKPAAKPCFQYNIIRQYFPKNDNRHEKQILEK